PLYVSVHATQPDIRIRLLKNPRAGQILEQLRWFQTHRLQVHTQVVVCPGINDGDHLQQTLLDLASFHAPAQNHQDQRIPTVLSIAVVPVGLTRFRPAEDELVPVTPDLARRTIAQVQPLQAAFQRQYGSPVAWLADEWFLIAGQDLPPASHYQDYPQIGNGVGSIRQFLQQFQIASQRLPNRITPPRILTWVVGNAVERAFQPVVSRLNQVQGLTVQMVALRSDYWGQAITVTGLLTGQDLIQGLTGKALGDRILLPAVMLKHDEARFLDDMTVDEVASQLNAKIVTIMDIEHLVDTICQLAE
ncbi:MAG: DUF512 domain-containing protein, partial [Cyanobacteria bacterium]|nr:DUF512 domain-containing protein [Cyanobacteriota bacterium]MDW8201437.1 DUF512 domain-containing protein [Cyanobacteriota bacterium SKYGB_h_bin112]